MEAFKKLRISAHANFCFASESELSREAAFAHLFTVRSYNRWGFPNGLFYRYCNQSLCSSMFSRETITHMCTRKERLKPGDIPSKPNALQPVIHNEQTVAPRDLLGEVDAAPQEVAKLACRQNVGSFGRRRDLRESRAISGICQDPQTDSDSKKGRVVRGISEHLNRILVCEAYLRNWKGGAYAA